MGKLVVVAGRTRIQEQRASSRTITPEQIETFFATLADTCNVLRAAKAAGFAARSAYQRRKVDAEFRNSWAAAVREGYAKLELVLLERAMKGTPKLVRTAKGNDRVMREYSTALAVALLRRHAETADSAAYEPGEDELREVRERILEKLERLKEREEAKRSGIETKAARDRVGLILWALRHGPSTIQSLLDGPPPHRSATGRSQVCRSA